MRQLNGTTTAIRVVAFILLWFAEFSVVSGAAGILGQFAPGAGSLQAGPVAVSAGFLVFSLLQLLAAFLLVYGDVRPALWLAVGLGLAGLVALPFLLRLPIPVLVVIAGGYALLVGLTVWLLGTGRAVPDALEAEAGDVPPGYVLAALLLAVQSAVFALFLIAGALSGSLSTLFYGIFAVAGLVGAAGVLLRTWWGYPAATAAAAGTALVGVLLALEVPIFGFVILAAALTALVLLIRERM